ncbi:MAG: anthranilate phosphoribosyltransferase, partial [Gemmatimonadales bacterium]
AHPEYQVMGVYDARLVRPIAETLRSLGCRSALVVNGGGLDEIALHGPTRVARLADGAVTELEIVPEDGGLERRPIADLAGGDPEAAVPWLRRLLAGRGPAAHAAAVALNAGAMLWVAGIAGSFREGVAAAGDILAGGAAAHRLAALVECSRGA